MDEVEALEGVLFNPVELEDDDGVKEFDDLFGSTSEFERGLFPRAADNMDVAPEDVPVVVG